MFGWGCTSSHRICFKQYYILTVTSLIFLHWQYLLLIISPIFKLIYQCIVQIPDKNIFCVNQSCIFKMFNKLPLYIETLKHVKVQFNDALQHYLFVHVLFIHMKIFYHTNQEMLNILQLILIISYICIRFTDVVTCFIAISCWTDSGYKKCIYVNVNSRRPHSP
jgi:hypothetical protein